MRAMEDLRRKLAADRARARAVLMFWVALTWGIAFLAICWVCS